MTDNTPRHEPMSREQVLAVLDKALSDLLANDGEYNFHTAPRERLHQARHSTNDAKRWSVRWRRRTKL
jgi:hypothetical protein